MYSNSGKNLSFGSAGSARCSILVVSSDELLLKNLITAILEINYEVYGGKFQVNGASSVSGGNEVGNTDYVVIIVNPRSFNWDTIVEENINQMDKVYLCNKFCLVVDTSSVSDVCAENTSRINKLKKIFAMPVFFGEFKKTDILNYLSQRLINVVNGVCCNDLPSVVEFPNSF